MTTSVLIESKPELARFLRTALDAALALARAEGVSPSPEQEDRLRRDAAGDDEAACARLEERFRLQRNLARVPSATLEAMLREGRLVALRWSGGWLLVQQAHGREITVFGPSQQEGRLTWSLLSDWLRDAGAAEVLSVSSVGAPDEEPAATPWARLSRLFQLDRRELWGLVIYAAVVGAISLAVPLAVQALVNTVAFGTLLQPVLVLALLLLAALAFAAWLRGLQAKAVEALQERLFVRVTLDLAFRLPRVSLESFDGHPAASPRYFYDVVTAQKAMAKLSMEGLALVLQTLIGLTLLALYHPLLLGMAVLLLLAVTVILFGLGQKAVATAQKESKTKHNVAGWLQGLARGNLYRQAGGSALALRKADGLAREYIEARRKHYKIVFRQIVSALSLQVIASALLLGLGGWLVIRGQLTIGQLVAAELVLSLVLSGLSKLGKHLETLYDLLAGADKLGALHNLPQERSGAQAPGKREGAAALALGDLTYQYEGQTGPALRGISLSISPRQRVGISGASGAGKTTLAELVAGVRAPQRGSVWLDNEPVAALRRAEFRHQVAFVDGPSFFPGSLAENVHLGRPEVSNAELRRCLEAVGLWSEVAMLPHGTETELNEHGAPLSRGQLARLAIARALAGGPRALVIDNALELLDPASVDRLLDGLFRWQPACSLILFTCNPAALSRCDVHYALEQGELRLVGDGGRHLHPLRERRNERPEKGRDGER